MAYILSFTNINENIKLYYKHPVSDKIRNVGSITFQQFEMFNNSLMSLNYNTMFWDLTYKYLYTDKNKNNPKFNFMSAFHTLSFKIQDNQYLIYDKEYTGYVKFNFEFDERLNQIYESFDINNDWILMRNTSIYKTILSREKYMVDNKINLLLMFPPWETYTNEEPEGGILQIYNKSDTDGVISLDSSFPEFKPHKTDYKVIFIPYNSYYRFTPLQKENYIYYFKKYLK